MAGHEQQPQSSTDYTEQEFQQLYQHDLAGWDDALSWLRTRGYEELSPSAAEHMILDVQKLQQDNVDFVADPRQAYELARQHRTE